MSAGAGFAGLTVLSLESRRATEQATLVSRFGGTPMVAPSLREVPLASHADAFTFAEALLAGRVDVVVLLTGVGTRVLVQAIEQRHPREAFLDALRRTRVVARGPKPLAVLRELGVPAWVTAREPNTWRELLEAIDAKAAEFRLAAARVAVQEYGVSNPDLLDALRDRGATVTPVPIYQWALPEDIKPLGDAVEAVSAGRVQVLLLTSGVQLAHLFRVAGDLGRAEQLRHALQRVVIASIGPTTSEEIRRQGLEPDLEASHPKMGVLVTEAAATATDILARKRA
jgi:uroporphyrinogen-III synthase